jgi:putative ABC transport system permease protein
MIRSFLSLFRSHLTRLVSMSLIFAIVIMMITLVNQIITNIDNQITTQTKPIVGADMIVSSSQPFSGIFLEYIDSQLLKYDAKLLQGVQFYTTVWQWTDPKLVQVKGIEQWYPWYGDVIIAPINANIILSTGKILITSGVYLDEQTYNLIEQSGFITLWESNFPVLGIISQQVNIGFNVLNEGRTVLMPYNLVKSTKLTDLGSRVEYQLQIKTQDETKARDFKNAIQDNFDKQYQVSLASQRLNQLEGIISQLNQYTSIILIITVILSLTIMSIASMTMTMQIKQAIGVMRVLGLTKKNILKLCIALFWSMFIIGIGLGIALSFWLFSYIITFPLAKQFVRNGLSVLLSAGIGIISFIIACRTPLRFLVDTHPLVLLKSSEMQLSSKDRKIWFIIWIIWSCLILFMLTWGFWFSLLVVFVWLVMWALLYWCITSLFSKFRIWFESKRSTYFSRYDAIRETSLPGNQTALLVWWLMLSLIAFCIITAVSISFINRLRVSSLDQPNIFVLNVRTIDIPIIERIDKQAKLYDTVLGRIQSVNGLSLSDYLNKSKTKDRGEFTREFNATTRTLSNSPVIAWSAILSGGISLDESFAKDLWVTIGDKIGFYIQGRSFLLTVTSLRKRIIAGTEPFFYIQLDEKQFQAAPRTRFWSTYKPDISSFQRLSLEQVGPHLSFIDIGAVIGLVTDIATKVIAVVLACTILIIILIICVSVASNEASALLSKNGYKLYHILGMRKSDLLRKSWYMVLLYGWFIISGVLILSPIMLYFIYKNASLLAWSYEILVYMLLWIGLVLMVLALSYWGFHKRIIKGL